MAAETNGMDATELKQRIRQLEAQVATLEESRRRFRATLYSIGDGVIATDEKGAVVQMNPVAEALTGWSEGEAVGKPANSVFAIINEETRAPVESPVERVLREGKIVGLANHTVLVSRDGVERPVADSGAPIYDEQKALAGVVLVFRDQTAERKAAVELRERIKELSCLQEIGRIVEAEGGALDRIFERAIEVLKRSWMHAETTVACIRFDEREFCTGDLARCGAVQTAALTVSGQKRGSVQVGYRETHPEQDEGPFMREERELLDAVSERLGHAIERQETERALHQSEVLNRAIVKSIPLKMFVKDRRGRYLMVNEAYARDFDVLPDRFVGQDDYAFYPRKVADKYRKDDAEVVRSGVVKDLEEHYVVEGETFWVHTVKAPVTDEEGRTTGLLGMFSEITARKKMEQELRLHHEQLDQLVGQRTMELEEATAKLRKEIAERTQIQAALDRKTRITHSVNRIFREALNCDSEEEVAETALKVAEDLTGSKFGFVGFVNESGTFDTIGLSNPGWTSCAVEGSERALLIRDMKIRGIWGTVIRTGAPQIINDPDAHPEQVGVPAGHPALTRFLGIPLKREDRAIGMIALANKDTDYEKEDSDAVETVAGAFHEALARKRMELEMQRQSRLKSGQNALAEQLLGDQSLKEICTNTIDFLCRWLDVPCGVLYLKTEKDVLELAAGYAYRPDASRPQTVRFGEGLVGQAALAGQPTAIDEVPSDYFKIGSGLGETLPRHLYIRPIVYDERVCAVVELGTLAPLGPEMDRFLRAVDEPIAFALESAWARERQAHLLAEAQRMAEELQAQQEELKTANEELQEQTDRLSESEERLKAQQEELQVTNEELEEKNELLEEQKREVQVARQTLEEKAEELAQASKYKSEFLANMSHELRTPLNSLLLLSRALGENKTGNLSADQVESAQVIHSSGTELLSLINEILDLSKIEAGHVELQHRPVALDALVVALRRGFVPLAEEKGLEFAVELTADAPKKIVTDRKRVEQVLRNLVANALKFTQQGHVRVTFDAVGANTALRRSDLDPQRSLAVRIEDTGIGISPKQQKLIFEAFQQADGTTTRKYGGTGLGLSISRELVALLGGEIHLQSAVGKGTTFTVFLPCERPLAKSVRRAEKASSVAQVPSSAPGRRRAVVPAVNDDRANIDKSDRTILIIEDDAQFARILSEQCCGQGFKVLAAASGEEGLDLVNRFNPQGVLLDLKLPGIDGWRVLEAIKDNPQTRHIPIHIVSVDAPSARAPAKGAIGYVQKPVSQEQIDAALQKIDQTLTQKTKKVLVVDDNQDVRKGIVALIADETVTVDEVADGTEAVAALEENDYDCMILDLGLRDCDGVELLETIERTQGLDAPPVIVYTGRELSWEQNLALREYSESIIIKDARSDERLLDEVSLFLHRVVAKMPDQKQQVITNLHDTSALLRDKTVLLVDDDMRTLFALTRMLSERSMNVLKAENGQRALEVLDAAEEVDVVLMDIMMPVLDGYDAMKRIRAQERFAELPIIAFTAKAMKGDQEKCIVAGANDYLPKPIDQQRLLSMLRVWLYR
jgi:PAS domain S-box-containing protein